MRVKCAHCRKVVDRLTGHVNRSRKVGMRIFCGLRCSAAARKLPPGEKARRWRAWYKRWTAQPKIAARRKAQKRASYRRTFDPQKAAITRKARMPYHVAYCRRPAYRKKKSAYDKKRRETNLHARVGMPKWVPTDIVQSIDLLRTLRKVQREYKRA